MPAMPRSAAAVAHSDAAADASREFEFSDEDFRSLSRLAYEQTGIVLAESKRNLVYSRLSRRLRVLGLKSFRDYRNYLAGEDGALEIENFVNSISTNLTKFFREAHHFDHFRSSLVVPFAQQARGSAGSRLRIWSAGCSTGEEAYTIAMVLLRDIRDVASHDVRVLATDIDTDVIARAAFGEYAANSIDDVPKAYHGFFHFGDNAKGPTVRLCDKARSLIAFRKLNLLEAWPFRGQFDAIFCRNVMIYFDGPTKAALIERFIRQIKPGGWLYIGHSESLLGAQSGLKAAGRTIYRRDA